MREDQATAIALPWHHPVTARRVLYVVLNSGNCGLFPFRKKCKVNGLQHKFGMFLTLQYRGDVCMNWVYRTICHTPLVLVFLL